ncbi:MAG: hypothetical protein JRI36_02585 [Deltaproteobacteria bacterium]|nr:hypothetical protein [Deltaproteobacteria bacterium]
MAKKKSRDDKVISIGKHSILKPARVSIKTADGSVIQGSVNVGFERRVSNLFIDSESPFVVLFDATIPGEGSGKILVLNKAHIVWVEPEEARVTSDPRDESA